MRSGTGSLGMARLGASLCLAIAMVSGSLHAQEPSARPEPSQKVKDAKPAEYVAEVLILHATRAKAKPEKPEIDPRIGKLPELGQEPFSRLYDRYELLRKERVPLLRDDPRTIELPNGRVLRTALLPALSRANHVRLAASINQPGGKTFLPLLEVKAHPGQSFIVAGQSYKNGILVLVIRVVK